MRIMPKHEKINWCSNFLTKIFIITVFLQSSFGFDTIEDDYSASESGLSQYLEEGLWNILMKLPRGYMVPMPRVGRRQIHREQKRQNMIPQPRIGRQLDITDRLNEILYEIQNYLLEGRYPISAAFEVKTHPGIYNDRKTNNDENRRKEDFTSDKASEIFLSAGDGFTNVLSNDNQGTDSVHSSNNERNILESEAMNSGFNIFDGSRRQTLIPLSQLSRSNLLSLLSDGNLERYATNVSPSGRKKWEHMSSTMIPYPRAGRVVDPEFLDYDLLLNVDYSLPELEESFPDANLKNQPLIHKRRNLKLIPRIGRKKRSISDEVVGKKGNEAENYGEVSKSEDGRQITDMLDSFDTRYFFPDEKRAILKNARFNPRIGKKFSDHLEEYLEEKRAKAFTPRIGRAALIPRIGRNDPRFRLKNRAFIPRIGRRAALIPRIGRSENSENQNSEIN